MDKLQLRREAGETKQMPSACSLLTSRTTGHCYLWWHLWRGLSVWELFGQPAIAARLSFVPGGIVGEYTYLFGPEYHMRGKRFRPYADFHLGFGNITYAKGKTEENYTPPPRFPTTHRLSAAARDSPMNLAAVWITD